MLMWHIGTWFTGGLARVRLTVGLDDLSGLFQRTLFYDSACSPTTYFSPHLEQLDFHYTTQQQKFKLLSQYISSL